MKKGMQEALQNRIKELESEKPHEAIQGFDSIKQVERPAVQGLITGK